MADACEHTETEVWLEWAERWLSPSRLSSYLDLCGGDVELALELHEWNLMLGRVLMGDIAHFELALRNVYDRALTERFQGDEHWLFDADMLSLFKALSPLAYESLHGNEKKTTVEKFLENHPAPVGVRL